MNKNVAIVHYNTPELTEATILSIRKHGGKNYTVFIFDNSDSRPFFIDKSSNKKELGEIIVFDNTKGQYIDFDKELEKYPDRDEKIGCAKGCVFGSDKHMMSVQKLWELIPDGFILMDSDILIRQPFDFMFMENECVCGHISYCNGPDRIPRLAPMLLWINVPMCVAGGALFFDPDRSWALHKGMKDKRNFWDTGAALLDDIKKKKPQCHGRRINIKPLMLHYGNGSWQKNDKSKINEWLEKNKDLWHIDKKRPKYSVLTYIFNGYEQPHEIEEKDPEAEYILVTDDPNLKSNSWSVFYDGSLTGLSAFDKCYQVRFHPFRYVNTNTVIRIDGSIKIKKSLKPFIDKFNCGNNYDRCVMIHPMRNDMKSEYMVWVKERNYPQRQASRCLTFMSNLGYDISMPLGLYQGCFEILRKSHVNELVNAMTFDFLRFLGSENEIERLDQTITTFVINHFFSKKMKILPVPESIITASNYMQWHFHNSNKVIPDKQSKLPPILFGSPCDPWHPD